MNGVNMNELYQWLKEIQAKGFNQVNFCLAISYPDSFCLSVTGHHRGFYVMKSEEEEK